MNAGLKRSCPALLAVLFLLWASPALSVDLRGRVDSHNPYASTPFPLSNTPVYLWRWVPSRWNLVAQTITDPSGMYYFSRISPGNYMIQVHGQNFPVTVRNVPFQDIPPVLVRRY